jgi:glycerate 2-kinase
MLAFGKCAAAMARGALEVIRPREALVVGLLGDHADLVARGVTVRVGSHPEPSPDASRHAEEALCLAARAEGTLLVLVSGGGSALLERPAPGLSLETVRRIGRELMRAGTPIDELNVVRAALSSVKGGRLAAATSAEVLTLVVEDVIGQPELVASGPTTRPPRGDAREVLVRRGVTFDASVEAAIAREPPVSALSPVEAIVTNDHARRGAIDAAREIGVDIDDLGAQLSGEAREAGAALARVFAGRARGFVVGGETTVAVSGAGRGGRNQELVLGAYLERSDGLVFSLGTDGIDGASEHAGAFLTRRVWGRRMSLGLDARAALEQNDTAAFFGTLGSAIDTGPTGVNVADIACFLADPDG